MTAYYNEFDSFAAAWLRELIKEGHIAHGEVDERDIKNVQPTDLDGFTQHHFFAGIGGWSLALRLAGWPDDRPVWTGSCPCQPFSTAGKQKGKEDERHLWPVWFRLIRESRPSFVFGEQVPAAIRHHWWDDVADDLESEGYTTRAEIRPASSVGAPHKRDRLWFVGNREHDGSFNTAQQGIHGSPIQHHAQRQDSTRESTGASGFSDVANRQGTKFTGIRSVQNWKQNGLTNMGENNWFDSAWIKCPDGKHRLVKPSICLLADELPNRVGKLRGYGNAIVPQVAAEFISAFMEME